MIWAKHGSEINRRYLAGEQAKDLAAEFGFNRSSLQNYLSLRVRQSDAVKKEYKPVSGYDLVNAAFNAIARG